MSTKTLLILAAAGLGFYLWRKRSQALQGLGYLSRRQLPSFTNRGAPVPFSPSPRFRAGRAMGMPY